MNKVLYDELLKAINEADEDSMVTDKEAEPDYTDQDDIENEEVPDIEDANDELKESIYEFLNDLKASGIPVTEDDISNVIYDHITNIVESAKLVGVMETEEEDDARAAKKARRKRRFYRGAVALGAMGAVGGLAGIKMGKGIGKRADRIANFIAPNDKEALADVIKKAADIGARNSKRQAAIYGGGTAAAVGTKAVLDKRHDRNNPEIAKNRKEHIRQAKIHANKAWKAEPFFGRSADSKAKNK